MKLSVVLNVILFILCGIFYSQNLDREKTIKFHIECSDFWHEKYHEERKNVQELVWQRDEVLIQI